MDWIVLGAIFFVAVLAIYYPQIPLAAAVFRRSSRPQLLPCPPTGEKTTVQLDAKRAAWTALLTGSPRLRVKDCARWGGGRTCTQGCLVKVT